MENALGFRNEQKLYNLSLTHLTSEIQAPDIPSNIINKSMYKHVIHVIYNMLVYHVYIQIITQNGFNT